jgi:hypothetical protein
MKSLVLIAIGIMFCAGCASPTLIQLSPDTYVIYKEDHAGVFGNPYKEKEAVIKQANEFAAKQGKVVVPILLTTTPPNPMVWPKTEYKFRVVSEEAARNVSSDVPEVEKVQTRDIDFTPLVNMTNQMNAQPSAPKTTNCTSTVNSKFGTVDTKCTER